MGRGKPSRKPSHMPKGRGHKAKRERYASKNPRGDKHGGQRTNFKRNVKQAAVKRRLAVRWSPIE